LHQHLGLHANSQASANGRTAHSYHSHHTLRLGWCSNAYDEFGEKLGRQWPANYGIYFSGSPMQSISLDQLLFEVQDIIRSMPDSRDFGVNPDKCIPWLGRASAAMTQWNSIRAIAHFEPEIRRYASLQANAGNVNFTPFRQTLLVFLHQAENDLRLRTAGPLSIGLPAGRVFEYFDEVRKLIEVARNDLLIVDPYLDTEFVSRYLPFVPSSTCVRLLARERVSTLKPAVEAYKIQTSLPIEVRTITGFHDRYIFVDQQACYQSGASFKDGAKKTPTILVQITDAFPSVKATYEQLWQDATVV
jgi:hypothetical protein